MRGYASVKLWSLVLLVLGTLIVGMHLAFEQSIIDFLAPLRAAKQSWLMTSATIFVGLSLDVILPIPSSVLSVWAVVSLGNVSGFFTIWLGMCASCAMAYYIGAGGRASLSKKFFRDEDVEIAKNVSLRYGVWAIILFRALPVLAEASMLVAGMVKMPIRKFLWVSSLANAGIALAYTLVGSVANAKASFALAFFASIAIPLVTMGIFKIYLNTRNSKALSPGVTRENPMQEKLQPEFTVDYVYPLHFTHNVFSLKNRCLIEQLLTEAPGTLLRALFYIDQGVVKGNPDLLKQLKNYCAHYQIDYGDGIQLLPGGEAAKTQANVERMHKEMLDAKLDRQSYIIAVGGGAVLDAVGYAASTFHRGIRLIRMPTTVLGQNDAGIGVKNGINAHGIKNLLGAFSVPNAIINDRRFLNSLSDRDFRSGFAEAIKVGLIRDANFFCWIEKNITLLNERNENAALYLIQRCAELHLKQICKGGDPFEKGSARPLDYGHWSAHKLETISQHALNHGEAVAIGMTLDTIYANSIGMLSDESANRIVDVIRRLGFSVWHSALLEKTKTGEYELLCGLEEFRQHLGGSLCITLLKEIGQGVEVSSIDEHKLLLARDYIAQKYC